MAKVKLEDAIEEYLGHRRARGMKPSTLKNAAQPLRKALALWGNILVQNITDAHVDQLFAEGGWSPRTQNLYLQQMRLFFKWARNRRYMARDYDPSEMWRNLRTPTHEERLRIPPEKFPLLLDCARHPRDRMIIALGLFTFMRGSEIQTLKIKDFDLGRNEVTIVRHKTQDHDVLPLSAELLEEIRTWLNHYRREQGGLDPEWYFVPSKDNPPYKWRDGEWVAPEGLAGLKPDVACYRPYNAIKGALRDAGFPDHKEGVHTLRRSGARAYADYLRDSGYDNALMRVASMLGHKSTKVTEHYVGWALEREQRNEALAGKPMLPGILNEPRLKAVN